jgi:hypothetical protein
MAGFSRLTRSGRARLNTLPTLTNAVAATVTGSVHPAGAQVRVLLTASVNAGQPSPDAVAWSAPITSNALGNWTTSLTPPTAGLRKIWVAMVKNPTNMWGQTKTVL